MSVLSVSEPFIRRPIATLLLGVAVLLGAVLGYFGHSDFGARTTSPPSRSAALIQRRDLPNAGFARVIESALGTADNFDTISLHSLPNSRNVDELWPDQTEEELKKAEAE